MITISALYIYPVKSCQGIALERMELDRLGPLHDRRFMVVDETGMFLTQREHPRLALVRTALVNDSLLLSAPGLPELGLALADAGRATAEAAGPARAQREGPALERRQVTVWGYTGTALDLGELAAEWFTALLGTHCRVVRVADDTARAVNRKYARFPSEVGFADGYPALLLSEASLSDLSARVGKPLDVRRFRPNIVVKGTAAYAEDDWKEFSTPSSHFDVVKPCERCVITTLDPDTLEASKEPLLTLASYRKRERGVVFAQNCVHHGPGWLSVGDPVNAVQKDSPKNA